MDRPFGPLCAVFRFMESFDDRRFVSLVCCRRTSSRFFLVYICLHVSLISEFALPFLI